MPIPDYETLMLPLLRYVAQGQCPIQTATSAMADQFALDESDRRILLPSGRTPLINSRVHWAATYLVQSGLLSRPRRGILQITERGRSVLAENPDRIDNELLLRFEEFRGAFVHGLELGMSIRTQQSLFFRCLKKQQFIII